MKKNKSTKANQIIPYLYKKNIDWLEMENLDFKYSIGKPRNKDYKYTVFI